MKQILPLLLLIWTGCRSPQSPDAWLPVCQRALTDSTYVYYTDFSRYPADKQSLPIAVFDSGTGGFTVLEKLLAMDCFDNETGEERPDGVPDLLHEEWQYLADLANMPYGRYADEGREAYLRELAVKDALFCVGTRFWTSCQEVQPTGRKLPAKIVVIACNTATAYGLELISLLLERAGHPLRVIGVVEAGATSTLEGLDKGVEEAAVGVLATPGTIRSGVYERTLLALAEKSRPGLKLQVVGQPGYGLAEAVDGEAAFVDSRLSDFSADYRGPGLGEGDEEIHPQLLDAYGFDYSEGKAFIAYGEGGRPCRIQLNSADNYARFNLLNLLEKVRRQGVQTPLQAIVMGCTHYPFLQETLSRHLEELRGYTAADGSHPYQGLIAEDCRFVDPARRTAYECYRALQAEGYLNPQRQEGGLQAFVSRPSALLPAHCVDAEGNLTYDFKYGRTEGSDELTTVVVPLSAETLRGGHLERIGRLLPLCHRKLVEAMR